MADVEQQAARLRTLQGRDPAEPPIRHASAHTGVPPVLTDAEAIAALRDRLTDARTALLLRLAQLL